MTGYSSEAIFKQSIEVVAWFLLTAFSKIQGERSKEGIVKQKGIWLIDLKNSQLAYVAKKLVI